MKNSKRTLLTTAIVGLISFMSLSLIGTVWSYTGEKYASQAKITLQQAEKIALKVAPGKIKDEEFEVEKGGSGLRYSFDIFYKHLVASF